VAADIAAGCTKPGSVVTAAAAAEPDADLTANAATEQDADLAANAAAEHLCRQASRLVLRLRPLPLTLWCDTSCCYC